MRLILVRHGETPCNIEEIWHGWDECELTETGRAQAEAVGRRLAEEPIDVIYSSPSRRARQTAEAIARHHDLPIHPEPGLRERNAGDFEGVLVTDVIAQHPTVWEDRAADYWNWRPPGGESFQEVLARTLEAVERLRERHHGQTVVAVTHMGPARVLMSHYGGVPMEKTYEAVFPSTGVSIFSLHEDEPVAELLNDGTHVEVSSP